MLFDEDVTSSYENGLFGIPTEYDSSELVILPVPWEATTSYGSGASHGPQAILQASPQIDFHIPGLPNHFESGFHLLAESNEIQTINRIAKPLAANIKEALEKFGVEKGFEKVRDALREVNSASDQVNAFVYEAARNSMQDNKLFGVLGGDHSCPYGFLKYLSEVHSGGFGVLHIDAHMDLRSKYQGFNHSHASIMNNVMHLPQPPQALVQVGVRDFSMKEAELGKSLEGVFPFTHAYLQECQFSGQSFSELAAEIIDKLPQQIYVSLDIDGLDPSLCPNTGTPVPGGLYFQEVLYLLKTAVRSGRRIIGFDLCEVSPDPAKSNEWDANVGSRVLFQLCSWAMESQNNG